MEKIVKSGNFNVKLVSHDKAVKVRYDTQTEDIRAAFTVKTYIIYKGKKYFLDDMVNISRVVWSGSDGDFLQEFDYYTLSGARGIAIKFNFDNTVTVTDLTYTV